MQKTRDSFTCSFLALTCLFHLSLINIFKKFRLFPKKSYFCFYCAIYNKQMDEISKFPGRKKKSQKWMKRGNFTWNFIYNQTLRHLTANVFDAAAVPTAVPSLLPTANYWFLILKKKKGKKKHLMWKRNPVFFYIFF